MVTSLNKEENFVHSMVQVEHTENDFFPFIRVFLFVNLECYTKLSIEVVLLLTLLHIFWIGKLLLLPKWFSFIYYIQFVLCILELHPHLILISDQNTTTQPISISKKDFRVPKQKSFEFCTRTRVEKVHTHKLTSIKLASFWVHRRRFNLGKLSVPISFNTLLACMCHLSASSICYVTKTKVSGDI